MSERARPATLEDLKRVLAALHAERADYLLIGGYGLIAHGFGRTTVDIDLLVPARREAADPIRRALLVLPDKAAAAVLPEWFEEKASASRTTSSWISYSAPAARHMKA